MTELGHILGMLRAERNYSQRQLAQKIGVNGSTIALYESGERKPSIDVLVELSRVFSVSTDYLLGINDRKDCYLDVSDLSHKQIDSLKSIIENYREQNNGEKK